MPLGLSIAARTCCFSALAIICQLYVRDLGGSRLQISLASTLTWAAIMLFSRFWGAVSDVFMVRRRTILVAAMGATLATLFLVQSSSIAGILVGIFLVEGFGAGVAPAALSLLSARGTAESRGKRISIVTLSQSIGMLSGSLLGGFLSWRLPFSQAFGVVAAVSGVAVVAAILIPRQDGGTAVRERSWRAVLTRIPPSFGVVTEDRTLREHGLLHVYGGVILRKAGILGIYGLIMVYLQESLGLTPLTSGALSAINPASQAIFMPLWGGAADTLGRRPVFLAGYVLTLLVPALILFSDSVWPLIGAFFVLGVGFAGFILGITAYIGDVAPKEREGELMGLVQVSQGLGGIVGPLAAGVAASPSVVGYEGMFVTMFALMLAGLVLISIGTRPSQSGLRLSESRCPGQSRTAE
ncbi:MAG: MFS transporter [Anaerolineae bacterium]